MIIQRQIIGHLQKMLTKFPIVWLTGPRQSGKTTLLKSVFTHYKYFNLERIDIRDLFLADPMGFLNDAGPYVIFDEAQNIPELFNYIQVVSDELKTNGQYILSGSQSFMLNNHISQSLAGRVSVNNLFPFDITELNQFLDLDVKKTIIKGFYPRLHDQKIEPDDFYPSYLQTYIERDIRTLKSVENLQNFSRFLGLCAGRTGQILNLTSLANDAGIAVNTVKSWLSLLEASYIIFLLQPYFNNFSKRIIKSPKIYFYDTGVASSLLRITNPEVLKTHYLYGALFENLVISEIIKCQAHTGKRPSAFYWRESNGTEIDCIVDKGNNEIIAIEIKGGQTFSQGYLKNLKLFPGSPDKNKIKKFVIYPGRDTSTINGIQIITWDSFSTLVKEFI